MCCIETKNNTLEIQHLKSFKFTDNYRQIQPDLQFSRIN